MIVSTIIQEEGGGGGDDDDDDYDDDQSQSYSEEAKLKLPTGYYVTFVLFSLKCIF